MHAHLAEVLPEARFHERAGRWLKRPAGHTQHFVNERRRR
jgi:hypothetical protein